MDLFALDKIILNIINNMGGYNMFILSMSGFIGITLFQGMNKNIKNKNTKKGWK